MRIRLWQLFIPCPKREPSSRLPVPLHFDTLDCTQFRICISIPFCTEILGQVCGCDPSRVPSGSRRLTVLPGCEIHTCDLERPFSAASPPWLLKTVVLERQVASTRTADYSFLQAEWPFYFTLACDPVSLSAAPVCATDQFFSNSLEVCFLGSLFADLSFALGPVNICEKFALDW